MALTDNQKWLYQQLTNRKINLGSEEQFAEALKGKDNLQWMYQQAKEQSMDIGDENQFFAAMSSQQSRPATATQRPTNFWQSIGAHDPYPQKTAEGVAQFEKEQQLQRESAATMPLSQQDKDRQAEIQRLQTDGIWGKPNGITMDIDKQTGLPTINQTKGDGMHLSIGATPSNQDEIDRLKAEQPAYITREIKTPQDLYTSVSEAWAANTPDGQKAKAELDKTAQDTYNNLLADMNRQIADLQQQVNNGTVTQQQAQQEAQRIADNTNAVYENEMQLAQDYFFRQMTDANADYLSQQARLLGQKATNQTISDINARIAPHIRQLETERQQAMQRASQSVQAQGGMYGAIGASMSANTAYKPEKDQELALYHQSQQFLADAAKISDAAQKGEGFWKGLGKSLGDIDTWDFGISQLTRSANLKDIVEKYERGEQLTDAEKGLMDSAVAYMSACAYNSDKINRRYKMGQTTGESIPFMLQFMVMPIGAIKDKVAKGVLGYGIEQFGGKAAQAAGKAAAKYGAKTAFKEAGTALLSNLAAAGVQTAAFGVPKIAEGAISRMTGDIQPTITEQGNIAYNGRRNQQSAASAVWNSAVDMYAENLSEMILTSLDPLKAFAGTTKLFQGLKSSQIAQVLGKLNEGVIGKVRDRAQFRNYLEEVGEEYVGNLIRWGLSTDVNNAEDAGFSADRQIDTWLGLAPTSIAFVGAGAINNAVSGGIDRFQSSRAAKRLREIMQDGAQRQYLESLLRSRNSDDFSKNAHEVLKTILRDKELNEDTKRLIMDGIYSTYQSQLAQEAEQARTQAEAERQTQPEQPETANVSDSAQPQTQAQVQVNTEGEEHYQDADGNEVTFYRNADGSVTLRDENGNAAVDEHGNAVVLTQDEFDKYTQDSNLRRVDRELTPEQWTERENQLRQQYATEIRPNTHNDGNVYEVALASDGNKHGYIVGDSNVEIDDTTDHAAPRITNSDVVTVRYEDGTMEQVAAKDLNLLSVGSANDIVEQQLQPLQQYAQVAQTFRAGQEVTMDDGNGNTYTSRIVSVSEDGVEVEIENPQGEPDTTIIPNEIALAALHPVEQKQPTVDITNPKPIGTNKFGNVYQWVTGKAKEAAQFLRQHKNSYLKGVFHRDDIGDIDLVWGNDKAGLQHIIRRHIEEQTDFDSINEAIEAINNTIQNGRIVSENDSQCTIDDGTHRVAIAKDETGNWIVTAYDNSRGKAEKQRGNTNSPLVVPSTEQNNPSDVAFSHQENGDTSMSKLSTGKGTTNSANTQAPAPNIDTMSSAEIGATTVEYMGGDRATAVAYLEAERDKADAEVKHLAKQKVTRYTDIADFKRQNDELQAAKKSAADRYNKLQNAIATANNYKTKVEQAAENSDGENTEVISEQLILETYNRIAGYHAGKVLLFATNTDDTVAVCGRHGVEYVADLLNLSSYDYDEGAPIVYVNKNDVVRALKNAGQKYTFIPKRRILQVRKSTDQSAATAAESTQSRPANTQTEPPVPSTPTGDGQEQIATDIPASNILEQIEAEAEPFEEIELTPANWYALFGEDGIVSTPIGYVKMGEHQYLKLAQKGRDGKLGMIKPTLEHPSVVVMDKSQAKDGQNTEREFSYVFVKAFVGKNGERLYYFTSITVSKDGQEVVISNQEKERSRIQRLLKNGKLAYINKATLPPASDKTIQGDQLTNPVGEELSSADKGTKNIPNSQTPEQKSAENLPNASQDEQSHTEEAPKDEQSKDNGGKEQSQSPKTFAQERTDVDLRTSRGAIQIQETESLPKEIAPKSLIEVAVDDDFGTIVRIGFKNKDLYVQTESKDADGKQWRHTFIVPNARQHAIANIADKFYGSQVSDFADEEREALKDALYKADTIEHLNAMRQGNIAYQKASAQITTETTDTEIHAIAELTEAPERQFAQWVDTLNAGNIRRVAKALNENTSLEAMRALGIAKRAFDRKAREELGDIAKNYIGSTYKLSDVKQVAIAYAADNIYHSDNVPNKEAIEAYVEKIYNEAKAARMTELEAELNKPLSLEEKKNLIRDISDGKTKVVLVTNKTIVKKLTELGATRKTIAGVAAALSRGDKVNGFCAKGIVILNTDALQTGNDIIAAYVHERQHLLTAADPQLLSAITDNATADELAQILRTITGTTFYDQYNNGTTNGHTILADELVSHIMQEAYATGKDAAEIAQNYGINNETILQTLNNIDYEQRQSNSLSKARRDNILGRNTQSSSRQSSRDNQTQSRDGLVQQGTRPAGKGSPRTPSRGQTTERGEIADTPVSALSFDEQAKSLKELILFQSKEEEQYFDSILPNLKEDKLGINSIPLEVILHENSIIEKLEGRVSDYIAEHYPTQGSVSALTNSPQGKKEREAMRKDPALAQLRKEVNAQQDAAQRKINGKYEEVKAIADNPSITLGEVAQLWNDALEFSRNLAAENDIRFSVGKTSDNLHKSLKSSTFAGKKSHIPKAELAVAYADMFRKQAQGQFADGNGFAYSANYFHSFERGHIVLSIPIEGNEDYITDYQKRHGTNSITGTFSQGAGHLWRSQRPSTGDNGIPQRQRSRNERVDRLHGAVRTDSASDNQKVNRDTQSDSQTELTDPRFSVSGTQVVPLGERTLVGLHNITSDKLRKVLKAGGLANPSAAVIDITKQDHHGYGEISLVMPSSLVDSREGNNAGTYTGDAYTPMYPPTQLHSGKDTVKHLQNLVKDLPQSMSQAIYEDVISYIDGNSKLSGLQYLFLKERGQELPIDHTPRHYPYISIEDVYDRLGIKETPGVFDNSLYEAYEKLPQDQVLDFNIWLTYYGNPEKISASKEKLKNVQNDNKLSADMKRRFLERMSVHLPFSSFDNITYSIYRDGINAGKENTGLTIENADRLIDKLGLRREFAEWENKTIDNLGYEEVLFAGYDRNGYKKYIPNTPANASRLMNKQSDTNTNQNSNLGETKSMLLDKLRTLAQIRKHRDILDGDSEKVRAAYDAANNDWLQLGADFLEYTKTDKTAYQLEDNPFIAIENALARIQEAMMERNPIAYLNTEYHYSLPADSEWANRIADIKKRIKDLPAKYFETKFKRPVSLNEFRNAVVPNDLSQDLRDGLEQAGLGLYEYDPETKGSRREATLQATEDDGIRFSVGATLATDKTLTEEARKEMSAIAEQAKANGTFMQAPNGNPTNLNERQWLQVRTRAFKNWFGDWNAKHEAEVELPNRLAQWLSKENIEKAQGKSRAEIIKEFGNEPQAIAYIPMQFLPLIDANLQDNRVYSGMGYFLDHAVNHHPNIAVDKYQNIQQVLNSPDEVKAIVDNGNNSIVFIKQIDRYNAVVIEVEKTDDGRIVWHKSFYDQNKKPYANKGTRLYEMSSEDGTSPIIRTDKSAHDSSLSVLDDAAKIRQNNGTTKSVDNYLRPEVDFSQVVDENGEPLVVYHGTPNEFTVFNGTYSSGMFMFTDVAPLAEKFANKHMRDGGRIVASFLNVRHPKTFEMEGYDWAGRGIGDNEGNSINKGRKHNFVYIESVRAKREKYDGVILYNVSDNDIVSNHYIAFSPNQIKSATANNGSFSENSDDIRFSIIGERNTPEAQYDELDYDTDNLTDAQQLATDAVLGALDDAGISVERVSEEEAEREVEKEKSESSVRLIRQIAEGTKGQSNNPITAAKVQKNLETAKRKLETATWRENDLHTKNAADVSSLDDAKVQQKIDISKRKLENQSTKSIKNPVSFISDILELRQTGSSYYGTFKLQDGSFITLRLSNHNATVSNFDNEGETEGVSIVISAHPSEGIHNDGTAHIVEYFYRKKDLWNAYGSPLADILGDISELLRTGEYKDTTGLAQRQEVNIPSEPLRTSNGTIYGYAKDGKIYLTDNGFNPNTPIHEYTHLWVKAVRNNNAELYDNLRDLFSRENLPDMWDELDHAPQYRDLSDEAKLSEIIARFSGKRGAKRMEQEAHQLIDDAKRQGKRAMANAVSLRERMRNLLRRFWNWVGEHLFHIKNFGSREEAADRVLYDLLNGTDLHQSPAEKDSQAEFSTSPMPKRMDGEMVHEWAKRIAEWKRQQVDEQQVAEYAKLLDQNGSKKSKVFAYIVDKFTSIDNFQQWVQAQGGVYNPDTMDMHSDISLALGRIETYSRRYKNDYMQRIADSITRIVKDDKIADPLLALGFKWQNFDNKKMNGKPLTVREIMGVYAQAKDTWEADKQGLSDRGAQGFVKNLGVSHTDIIEAVERIIPQKQLDEFWNAVYAANQFALDYQLNAGMLDTDTRNRYTRRYYVPQRGWRERDFDGRDTAYIKGNGTRLYGNPYNAALVKAHGRESLASDPFALIESIGLTSITQSEHNKSKQQLLNLLLANEMLGLKSGAWRVKQVWSKNVIDPRTGHIMRKPDGTPVQAEVTYAAPTQQEREHDADINAQIEQLRKELRDLTQPTARAKREAEIANLQDQLIYTGRATDTMLEHRTRDERLQHQIIVLHNGQQYVIELQDERLANAVNGNFGEAVKAYALFNKYNAPAIRYISGMLTQYNPRFAHRNFWRDAQAAFLNNLSEQGVAFTTRAMANIPMVQRTVWRYIWSDTYKNKESYGGQFGDYLREYFEAGAQTGFSFMPELERMAKDFNKMVKGENAWDKVWGKGVKGTLSLMTEASEITVRFAEYVTARQMGRSVQEAAKMAKNISVNFNQSGLLSKEMSKFFTFFNATIQGNMRFLMPYGKNKPKFGERAFKFGAKFAGMAANFALLGLLSTFLQPDNPDDDTWFTDYDRMSNFILFGKVKIPVVHFFRMYYAAGVQAALAAQGRKTWKDAFYTSTDYALSELVPTSVLQIQNFWDYDETTNTIELNPAKYAQAAAPSVISPLVDVAVNRDFKGSTVYRKKWDNDKKDITTAKRNTPQLAVDVSNTLHRWSGGNPDVPYKGGNTDGWIDIKPNAIEHLAQGYFSGVWESLGQTAGFIWDGAHDTDVYKHATNWPFLRDLFRDYSEDKAYNGQYYSVLQKLKNYEKRVNSLSQDEFDAEEQTSRFQTFENVAEQLYYLPNPYNDEEATVTSQDVKDILKLDIQLNRNLFDD